MTKLLSAGFARLKKSTIFWFGISFMFGFGILVPTMQYLNMKKYGGTYFSDDIIFNFAVLIGVVMAIFCSLFVGTEYSDGTIRNKLVIGHTRISVYLANLIICSLTGICLCFTYMIPCSVLGIWHFGLFQMTFAMTAFHLLTLLLLTIAYTAIFVLTAMLIHNKAMVSVITITGAFILLFTATYIYAKLQEPEIWGGGMYVDESGNMVQEDPQPNPYYLRGTKREIYEFLEDFLPSGQAIQVMEHTKPASLLRMTLYDFVILFAASGCGIIVFSKKDIK